MNQIVQSISEIGILPVITIHDSGRAVGLAKALCAGGIPAAEITFRTPAAQAAIREIAQAVPECLVGAGTVLNVEQAEYAVESGAKFLVSPGLNPAVAKWAVENGVPIIPGCTTPTEVEAALTLGLNVLKFFPAEASGGVNMLKSFAAPYGGVKFVPTGGIGAHNIRTYLALGNVAACGGSWMVPADLIDRGEFDQITALCSEAVGSVLSFSLAHVGVNTADTDEATAVAARFNALFGLPPNENASSIFAGSAVEVMKSKFLGDHGHIGFLTSDIDRAVAYLRRSGVAFNEQTAVRDDKGQLLTIYLEEQVVGFAVHLKRK